MNQNQEPDMVTRWVSNNVGVLLTAVVLAGSGVAGYTRLDNRVENIDAYRLERSKLVDSKLAEINAAVAGIPNLMYRVAANEEALKATNQRVDHSISNISACLAAINRALRRLSTSVAVLTQRFDQLSQQRRSDAGATPR